MKITKNCETEVVNALAKDMEKFGAYWIEPSTIREILYMFGTFARQSIKEGNLTDIPGLGVFRHKNDSIKKGKLKRNRILKQEIIDKNLPKTPPKKDIQKD